ncbi:hypothetical protein RvY_00142 [Ramazzottius varieornatus]|uniref:Zinc finger PHD-type domain-containing protein n=1 Tax=Ramazzottius varieornatus TaxID=947166 RepID=A0A1D1UI26_RAMVA|nr:hypothetical protein RvY_00142 [Ramazzottius varieornatus]
MKKLLLSRNKASPEDIPAVERKPEPLPDFRQAAFSSCRHFLEDDSLDSSSRFTPSRKPKLHEMFPSPCSMVDYDSDTFFPSSPSVAAVTPAKPAVLLPANPTTPPAEPVQITPIPQKMKKVRRKKRSRILPDGVTLEQLAAFSASTSTPPEWAAHFKKADFGTDYTLRPRTERPRYDLQSEEAVVDTPGCQNRKKPKLKDGLVSPKPTTKRRAVYSRGPGRKVQRTTSSERAEEDVRARLELPAKMQKLISAASLANGVHCICSSSLDIGPQIECEKCGLWQHMFCMNMFGKDTDGYVCNHCNQSLAKKPYNPEEALKAFSAYASSLPVTKDEKDEQEDKPKELKDQKVLINEAKVEKVDKVLISKAPKRALSNLRRKPGRPARTDSLLKTKSIPSVLRGASVETAMTSEPETPPVMKERISYGRSDEAAPETFNQVFELKKQINLKIVQKRNKSPLLTANPLPEFNSIVIDKESSHPPKNVS